MLTLKHNYSVFSKIHRNPYLYILLSYVLAIAVGSLLLMLPPATVAPINYIDAIYTLTSAVCVTGLTVLDTGSVFTFFGQTVILFFIQIGGIGVMVFSSFIMIAARREFSFLSQSVVEESMTMDRQIKTKKLLVYVVTITLTVEAVGALLLHSFFAGSSGYGSFYAAIFTSVSAFCNAGFSLFSNNLESYSTNLGVNLTLMPLIFIGGIGYFCIIEFIRNIKSNGMYFKNYHFSIHTKVTVLVSFGLIVVGAFLFMLFEHDKLFQLYSVTDSVLVSFFQSVTARTAGFNTFSFSKVSQATLILFGALMFIGASPASCGGGVKTTTFWLLIKSFTASIKNREHVFVFKRSVHKTIVKKAVLLVILAFVWIFIATILIAYFERADLAIGAKRIDQLIFEIISAFGTVGLSTGISDKLTAGSKIVIISTMYFGRTGLLTIVSFFAFSVKEERFNYPEEDIFVG